MIVATGRTLGERYRLEEKIASGGMGDVWRAEDTVLGRWVAVKVLRPEHAADPDFVERFRAEARHAAALSHIGIAAVHDYGETDDDGVTLAYLVMELVPGEALSAVIANTGPLSPERTLDLIASAADALQAAHDARVIHRDVKPGNILVRPGWDESAGPGYIVLTDFGIARATNEPGHLTRSGLVMGTAFYLSPEQVSGGDITPAADLYALGVVAYECLTGERPFSGESAVQVAVAHLREEPPPLPETVPEPVRELVDGLLAKDPAQRPASAAAVAAAARAILGGAPGDAATATRVLPVPVVTPTPDPEPAAQRPRWRRDAYPNQQRVRSLLLLVGLVVIVIGALLLALVGGGDGADRPAAASSTPTRTPAPTPATVPVLEDAYVRLPFAVVRQDLRELGLTVTRRDQIATAPEGTVIAVDPHGRVRAGSTVTVIVAAPVPEPTKKPKPGHGKKHGPPKDRHDD